MEAFYLDREKDIKIKYKVKYDQITKKYKLLYEIIASNGSKFLLNNLKNLNVTNDDIRNKFEFRFGNDVIAKIDNYNLTQNKYLSAESKVLLSQEESDSIHFVDVESPEVALKTDLHSHYAAILPPTYLIALGIKHNIEYDEALVKKYKLDAAGLNQNNEKYNFIELLRRPGNFEKIEKSLRLPSNGQVTFTQLERVYDARDPFTKGNGCFSNENFIKNKKLFADNKFKDIAQLLKRMSYDLRNKNFENFKNYDLQKDYLLWAARYTKSTGVNYLEASQAALAKPNKAYDFLKMLHDVIQLIDKEIDKDTSCAKIRFLAAVRRNAESDIDFAINAETIRLVSQSPYVVGCDFMGEELNETDYFKDVVKKIAENAIATNKDFTIRIHAGENQLNIHNVKQVLEIIQEAKATDRNNKIHLRIGHGLYGIENDEEAMELMKTVGAVNEFNLTSNVRLNNLSDIAHCPIRKYLEHGIQCVHGTDGGGIYGTTVADEQGLSQEIFEFNDAIYNRMQNAEAQFSQYADAIQAANGDFNPDNIRGNLNNLAAANGRIADADRVDAERYIKRTIENIKIINEIPTYKLLVIAGNKFDGLGNANLSDYNIIVQDDLTDKWIDKINNSGANIYHVISGAITNEQYENLQHKQVIIAQTKEYGGVYKVFESIFEKCTQTQPLISSCESGNAINEPIISNIKKAAYANGIKIIGSMKSMLTQNAQSIEKIDLSELPTYICEKKKYDRKRFRNAHHNVTEALKIKNADVHNIK